MTALGSFASLLLLASATASPSDGLDESVRLRLCESLAHERSVEFCHQLADASKDEGERIRLRLIASRGTLHRCRFPSDECEKATHFLWQHSPNDEEVADAVAWSQSICRRNERAGCRLAAAAAWLGYGARHDPAGAHAWAKQGFDPVEVENNAPARHRLPTGAERSRRPGRSPSGANTWERFSTCATPFSDSCSIRRPCPTRGTSMARASTGSWRPSRW